MLLEDLILQVQMEQPTQAMVQMVMPTPPLTTAAQALSS
jgi:hypothetical protein